MLATTGWCLATWLKTTLALAVIVAVVGGIWGWTSSAFILAVVVAIVLDLLAIRGLLRAWAFEARCTWWWIR